MAIIFRAEVIGGRTRWLETFGIDDPLPNMVFCVCVFFFFAAL